MDSLHAVALCALTRGESDRASQRLVEALPGADMEPDEHGIFEIRIEAGSWHAALGQVFDAVSASGMMTTSPLPSALGLPEHYRHGAGRP